MRRDSRNDPHFVHNGLEYYYQSDLRGQDGEPLITVYTVEDGVVLVAVNRSDDTQSRFTIGRRSWPVIEEMIMDMC